MNRTLFVLKRNLNYNFVSYCRRSSGLFNSTRFIVESLREHGLHAHIEEVHDGNDIDREIHKYKPTVVIIEALWATPEKLVELKKLHKHVKFYVHLHSNIPFLALEGIAMQWIHEYAKHHIGLIANSVESYRALLPVVNKELLHYLPNIYLSKPKRKFLYGHPIIRVGCFGAIRPLKNQLLQALAAIQFAKEKNKALWFFINASRIETGGEPVLKNLRSLFSKYEKFNLIEWKWEEPNDFLDLLHDEIDIGMQVSLTETFNVVSADYVTAGVPVVASKEVSWLHRSSIALDNDIKDIVRVMHKVYRSPCNVSRNQKNLLRFSHRAQKAWRQFLDSHK